MKSRFTVEDQAPLYGGTLLMLGIGLLMGGLDCGAALTLTFGVALLLV